MSDENGEQNTFGTELTKSSIFFINERLKMSRNCSKSVTSMNQV
jgi:hypothetical protein